MTDIACEFQDPREQSCMTRCIPLPLFGAVLKGYESDENWRDMEHKIDEDHVLKHLSYDSEQRIHTFEIRKKGRPQLRLHGMYFEEFDTLRIHGRTCCCPEET
jgi:hypothetical protein